MKIQTFLLPCLLILFLSCSSTPTPQKLPVPEKPESPAQSPATGLQNNDPKNKEASTQLEDLWESSRKHNNDLKNLEYSMRLQQIQLEHHRTAYAPSLTISSTTGFADSRHSTSPTSMEQVLNLTLPVISGTSLRLGGNYTTTRQPVGTNQDVTPWSHGVGINIGIVQSLYPYWMQGLKTDPHKSALQTTFLQSQEKLAIATTEVLKSLTATYIQLRIASRNIRLYQHTIDYYDVRLEAYTQLEEIGQVDVATIWQEEENLRSQREKLDSEIATIAELRKNISTYCGISPNTADFLPAIDTASLPPIHHSLASWDHQQKSLELEKEAVHISYVQKRQETFPTLSATTNISLSPKAGDSHLSQSWSNGQNINWSLTAAIDASSLLSSKLKKDTMTFQEEMNALQVKADTLATTKENNKNYCKNMIVSLQQTQAEQQRLLGNWQQKHQDLQELYERGGCSQLDVMTAEIQVKQKETQLLNTSDQLWYYQWLQNNL